MESREDVVRYLMWGPMDRAAAEAFVKRRIAGAVDRRRGQGDGLRRDDPT